MFIFFEQILVIIPPNPPHKAFKNIMPSPIKVIFESRLDPGSILMIIMPNIPRMQPRILLKEILSSVKTINERMMVINEPMESMIVERELALKASPI